MKKFTADKRSMMYLSVTGNFDPEAGGSITGHDARFLSNPTGYVMDAVHDGYEMGIRRFVPHMWSGWLNEHNYHAASWRTWTPRVQSGLRWLVGHWSDCSFEPYVGTMRVVNDDHYSMVTVPSDGVTFAPAPARFIADANHPLVGAGCRRIWLDATSRTVRGVSSMLNELDKINPFELVPGGEAFPLKGGPGAYQIDVSRALSRPWLAIMDNHGIFWPGSNWENWRCPKDAEMHFVIKCDSWPRMTKEQRIEQVERAEKLVSAGFIPTVWGGGLTDEAQEWFKGYMKGAQQ